jgi:hypothetical protein
MIKPIVYIKGAGKTAYDDEWQAAFALGIGVD